MTPQKRRELPPPSLPPFPPLKIFSWKMGFFYVFQVSLYVSWCIFSGMFFFFQEYKKKGLMGAARRPIK